MRVAYWLLVVALVGLQAQAEEIRVRNSSGRHTWLWRFREGASDWAQPLYLPRLAPRPLSFEGGEKHYIVFRDDLKRDTHVGWIDLAGLHRDYPGAIVELETLYVYEEVIKEEVLWCGGRRVVREKRYRVSKPVQRLAAYSDGRPVPVDDYID
ncbi:MAG: hypothetical protein HYS13_17620 [Planctomycetia bacterium]|nr:hypothetical protein [Planctomycetia bacterium]